MDTAHGNCLSGCYFKKQQKKERGGKKKSICETTLFKWFWCFHISGNFRWNGRAAIEGRRQSRKRVVLEQIQSERMQIEDATAYVNSLLFGKHLKALWFSKLKILVKLSILAATNWFDYNNLLLPLHVKWQFAHTACVSVLRACRFSLSMSSDHQLMCSESQCALKAAHIVGQRLPVSETKSQSQHNFSSMTC